VSLNYNHTCFYYVAKTGFGLPLSVIPDWVGYKPRGEARESPAAYRRRLGVTTFLL